MIEFCKTYLPVLGKASLKGFLEGPRMVLSNKNDTDERPSLITNYNNNYFTVFSIAWGTLSKNWVKYTLLGITLIILYSRVYLGVHYVSDVIGGAILGYLIAKLVLHFLILKQIKQSSISSSFLVLVLEQAQVFKCRS